MSADPMDELRRLRRHADALTLAASVLDDAGIPIEQVGDALDETRRQLELEEAKWLALAQTKAHGKRPATTICKFSWGCGRKLTHPSGFCYQHRLGTPDPRSNAARLAKANARNGVDSKTREA